MYGRTLFLSLALSLLAAASAGAQSTDHQHASSDPAEHQDAGMPDGNSMMDNMMGGMMGADGSCLVPMEGLTVTCEDLPDGVAMQFTTTGDVDGLRRQLGEMVERHNGMHGQDAGAHDHAAGGEPMAMSASKATLEEIAGGGRLVFTPADSADLSRLREHAHAMEARMSAGECNAMTP